MKLTINKESLNALAVCWPEATGYPPSSVMLEMCIHEIAHVLDITGDIFHYGFLPHWYIDQLPKKRQDFNEIRASAVTRWALITLGMLTPELEKAIFSSMEDNIVCMSKDAGRRWWGRMRNSNKSFDMGVRIAFLMIDLGVVE